MSLVKRLTTALGVVLILLIAGVVSVSAQAQAVVDNSPTSEPKKAEAAKPSLATSQNTESEKSSEISPGPTSSKLLPSLILRLRSPKRLRKLRVRSPNQHLLTSGSFSLVLISGWPACTAPPERQTAPSRWKRASAISFIR